MRRSIDMGMSIGDTILYTWTPRDSFTACVEIVCWNCDIMYKVELGREGERQDGRKAGM